MARASAAFGCLLVAAMATSAPANPKAPLALSLDLDTQEIVPFEPLRATVRVRNIGEEAIPVSNAMLCGWRFFLSHNGGPFEDVAGSQLQVCLGAAGRLEPGEELRSEEMLLCAYEDVRKTAQAFLFRHPGEYRVQVRLADGKNTVESPAVRLTVNDFSKADAENVHLFTKESVSRLLMGIGGDDIEAAIELLSLIVSRAPESAYADHAHYTLGRYFFSRADSSGVAQGADNVWALPEVQRWAARRAFEHFSAVSNRMERLKARAVYEQARMAMHMPRRYAEFAPGTPFPNLEHNYHAKLPILRQMAYGRRVAIFGGDDPDYVRRKLSSMAVLFVPDLRLDRRVVWDSDDLLPMEVVLALLSKQSGVPLDADATRKVGRRRTFEAGARPLRDFLYRMADEESYWERRGNGYHLVHVKRERPPGAIPGWE